MKYEDTEIGRVIESPHGDGEMIIDRRHLRVPRNKRDMRYVGSPGVVMLTFLANPTMVLDTMRYRTRVWLASHEDHVLEQAFCDLGLAYSDMKERARVL